MKEPVRGIEHHEPGEYNHHVEVQPLTHLEETCVGDGQLVVATGLLGELEGSLPGALGQA